MKPKIILSGGGGNQYDAYNRYFVLEADLGLNSTDQVGFILIDSNSCLGERSFRLKTIGQSKTETFWYEALFENFRDGARNQAVQFRSNSSEPIILVLEFSSWNFNFTEVSPCIDDVKMGILDDGKEPYAVDYTACGLGLNSKQSNL